MWSALLDACVLVPSVKRDVLLEVAVQGVYRPLWSAEVLDETERAIRRIRDRRGEDEEVTSGSIARLRSQFEVAFPDAMVAGWESMADIFDLPDSDDRHVVAAAVAGRADMIATDNVRDFPRDRLPGARFAETADVFLLDSLDLHEERVLRAVHNVARRTGRFGLPRSPREIAVQTCCAEFASAIKGLI